MFEYRWLTVATIVGLVAAITATLVLRADSFTPIAKMHVARSGHQATLLDDGRVLVTGGSDDIVGTGRTPPDFLELRC